MSYDPDRIQFHASMMAVAEEVYNASVEDGGQAYRDMVYNAYLEADAPEDIRGWLRGFFSDEFACVDTPPVWVGPEPEWPFFNDRPMVFICQEQLPDNELMRRKLTTQTTVYVFGSRNPVPDGYTVEYRVVEQQPLY